MEHIPPNLIFIVGFPRSGTTFLATRMGALDACAATPETRYFAEAVDERCVLSKRVRRGALKDELGKLQRISDLGLDLETALLGPDHQKVDRRDAFLDLIAEFGATHAASTVFEKSPVHTYYLTKLLRWYPQSKIIAIIRDGRDAFLSLRNAPWGDWSASRYAADWVYRNRLIERASMHEPRRVLTVRFEDLLCDPDSVVAGLARDLGLSETDGDGVVATIPEWEKEWKSKAADAADSSRVAVWKTQPNSKELRIFTAVAGDELRKLGYEAPTSTVQGKITLLLYPVKRSIKQALRKVAILFGQSHRISSQKGLGRRLG